MSAHGGPVTVFAPAGELTMVSAPAVLEDGRRLARAGDLVVDFAGVTVADSAALALWVRSRLARISSIQSSLLRMPK